jgi:quinoprotein glucose dehydrogenase
MRWLAAAVCAVTAGVGAITVAQPARDDQWWRDYAGGPDNSRYVRSTQINRTNVGTLAVEWTYPYGDSVFNPIVMRGIIYGRGRNGAIVALDAKTGKEIWIHEARACRHGA